LTEAAEKNQPRLTAQGKSALIPPLQPNKRQGDPGGDLVSREQSVCLRQLGQMP
jgi:hypothetical protein